MICNLLVLISMCYMVAKAQQQWHFRMISNATNNDLSWMEIGEELHRYTSRIPSLNMLLRAKHSESEAANPYVKWFLRNSLLPVMITTYDTYQINKTESLATFHMEDESFVIATDFQQLHDLAHRFVHRATMFFFVVSDTQFPKDGSQLRNVFQSLWIKCRTFKTFLLTFEGIFYFNPFDYDATRQEYGKIIRSNSTETLESALFRDMQGYPLRTQIFKSVYARPFIKQSNPSIKDVYGVDGRVAELLQKRLNFTMVLQQPDPNYFG